MKPFAESLLSYTEIDGEYIRAANLCQNNAERLNEVAELTHKKLSRFDREQLRELQNLEFGQGLLILADRYATLNPGLRTFEEWLNK